MIEIDSIDTMRRWRDEQDERGLRVGFVPTMGFLHEGHLQLIDRAAEACDTIVLSIFVNPTQFGPNDDFDRYPRHMERDRTLAAGRGVDCLFAPATDEVYPRPAAIGLTAGPLAAHLCGAGRPGHFAGVLQVVLKLCNIIRPDVAVFGRKDAQQAVILRRMVDDLNLPIELEVAPTVREPDGLALSSRNAYLSREERRAAAEIPRALDRGHEVYRAGAREALKVIEAVRDVLRSEALLEPEYVDAVDPDTLQQAARAEDGTIVALAVRIGTTRLIDNILLAQGTAGDVFLES